MRFAQRQDGGAAVVNALAKAGIELGDLTYLRRLRSQMSAAIDPTTPIAANPASASISGTPGGVGI